MASPVFLAEFAACIICDGFQLEPRRRQRVRKLQVHDEAVTAFGVVAHAVQLGEAGGYLPAGGNAGLAVALVVDTAHGVYLPAQAQ